MSRRQQTCNASIRLSLVRSAVFDTAYPDPGAGCLMMRSIAVEPA
jgi:hypothetical protein